MKNIIIPIDLTDSSIYALKYAISFGAKTNTKLFFYHANNPQKADIEKHVLAFVQNIFKELNIEFELVQTEFIINNSPFSNNQIRDLIVKNNIDLVIMGTKPDCIKTTFFGSVVSELINDSDCPVLSIPHGYTDLNIDRISYATELYDLHDRIKEIIPFARFFNASIEAFHVYPVFPQEVDILKFDVKKALNSLHSDNNYDKIYLHFIKTTFMNETIAGIRQFLTSSKPDMLVMYHKPRGVFDKFVMDCGATQAVIKTSLIPILALNKRTNYKLM